jgi:hypothetical protein
LTENHGGDELRDNDEVQRRFFDENDRLRPAELTHLQSDLAWLLMPSAARALDLDRAYQAIVLEQSFVRGRAAVMAKSENVYAEAPIGASTGIKRAIGGATAVR